MQEERKEIITKESIENDIKKKYKELIFINSIVTLGCIISFALVITAFINSLSSGHFRIEDIIFCGIFCLTNIVFSTNLILLIRSFAKKPLEYKIVIDKYVKTEWKFVFNRRYPHFCFEKCGSYGLPRVNYNVVYENSNYNKMTIGTLKNSVNAGDEFYLILVRNKIFNLYHTRIFELRD